jgi:hypothetical protein
MCGMLASRQKASQVILTFVPVQYDHIQHS